MTARPTLPTSWNAGDAAAAWPFTTLLFEAARLAYQAKGTGLPALRDLGLDPGFIERRSTQAYAANAGPDAIVAFRGTEPFGQAAPATLLESLDDAELDGIIEALEAEHAIPADPDQARMQGMIPWTADHSLAGYSTLVDAFINRTTA
jgi:hypothetical protein